MKNSSFFARMSLKTKMILSYLFVIVGTVIILSIAITAALQNYFYTIQAQDVQQTANDNAEALAQNYAVANGNWSEIIRNLQHSTVRGYEDILYITDKNGSALACLEPRSSFPADNCTNVLLAQIAANTLRTQQTQIDKIYLTFNGQRVESIYACVPVYLQGPTSTQIIGTLTFTEPFLTLSPSSGLLQQTNQSILLAGAGVALVAMFCSFLLVRRFVRPLENLTNAAELVKQGQYAQRVTPPHSQDELGRLAFTFNEMADRIEADVNELRRQDQLRRDLVANIAHDLATPLTAIQGFSEALADDVITDPSARHETAQRIGREVQRLRRMVAEIRQMSSLEAGQTKLDLAPLDMQSLVDETLAVIAPECENKGITVYNDIAADTPAVLADGDRITQVLLNLLDNARRYTPEGGMLRVGARVYGPSLFLSIQDTGTGINPQDLPHIFERFYRADRSRTTTTGGSGLGLAIVKAIIAAHRGNIWAESVPGKGTRITFSLPLVPVPGTSSQKPTQTTVFTQPR
jgi:two-component system, OmpR family, sensor histidine kinase BaeS